MKTDIIIGNIILFILIIILMYLIYKPGKYITSSIDDEEYFVSDRVESPTSEEIADTLALIRQNINKLRIYLKNKNNGEYQNYINELVNTTKDIEISENTKNIYTSYTINKKELVFCVRSKETGQIHNMNLLMYVVLHELAHIACPEYGHTDLFKKIFKYLLNQAEQINIYEPINFNLEHQEYCGMNISSG